MKAIRARFIALGTTSALRVSVPRRALRVVLTITGRDAAGNATVRKRTIRLVR